ncbi:cytochrome c-type biogenesis protein [uncultured Cohaesibacter sp.]|uniref:cytochrome c-type biogenesis protein n=1 Tax=uncultured Cohaesibacter sp. TaxID=1002546 RepID=UPI00374812B8
MKFSLQPRVVSRLIAAFLLALSFQLVMAPAYAVNPDEMLKDPQLEARAREISEGLRCLVCQNQSIDDSNAPLARDLRILVRERLSKGDSDKQVKSFLVDRYGEFVLLKPSFSSKNLLLWAFAPFVLIIGIMAIFLFYRRNRMIAQKAEVEGQSHLSEAEQERLNAILSDDNKD